MAGGTAVREYSSTVTTGGTAETVTLNGGEYKYILVSNRSATGDLYVRTDGIAASSASPADNFVVPAGRDEVVVVLQDTTTPAENLLFTQGVTDQAGNTMGAAYNGTTVSITSGATGTAYTITGN